MYHKIVMFIGFCIILSQLNGQNIVTENIKAHITYLASDKLEGRLPGTNGEKLAIKYITRQFTKYNLAPKGENKFKQSFSYTVSSNPHDANPVAAQAKQGSNVIGFLDNHAPYTVIIGGHFDHLGKGHNINALDTNKDAIHNGADDNASGTSGVLELARYFSTNNIKEKYNFLFICFSGEEDGLVGSKYFSNHPTIDLSGVSYMINMDMIGRLDPKSRKLLIYGLGTSPGYGGLIDTVHNKFKIVIDSSGVGPSDYTSFYLKNIPVLAFFTGQHSDYHKATDDTDKINFAGETEVLEYIISLVNKLNDKDKLVFTATKQKQEAKTNFKVTLGIMPDYTYNEGGLRIDAVTDGRPAQKAGLKAGDIIIELGGKPVKDIYEYMDRLSEFSKGDKAKAKVKREGQVMEVTVEF
ncbi:MAG TPA: M28 family peptidase [Saprospiraceae bacterium]|nr:M28 family peptidase [Saprospiraceae bacterium]